MCRIASLRVLGRSDPAFCARRLAAPRAIQSNGVQRENEKKDKTVDTERLGALKTRGRACRLFSSSFYSAVAVSIYRMRS